MSKTSVLGVDPSDPTYGYFKCEVCKTVNKANDPTDELEFCHECEVTTQREGVRITMFEIPNENAGAVDEDGKDDGGYSAPSGGIKLVSRGGLNTKVDKSKPWSCAACTTRNKGGTEQCHVCLSKRSEIVEQPKSIIEVEYDKIDTTMDRNMCANFKPRPPRVTRFLVRNNVHKRAGEIVLHKCKGDNSCLFHAIAYTCESQTSRLKSAYRNRLRVANTVESQPQKYNTGFLGKAPSIYTNSILNPNTWGGGIELDIFSRIYQTEIFTFDFTQPMVTRFGLNQGYDKRVFLVYGGAHYDCLVFSPKRNAVDKDAADGKEWTWTGFDDVQEIFDPRDNVALHLVKEFVESLYRVRTKQLSLTYVTWKGRGLTELSVRIDLKWGVPSPHIKNKGNVRRPPDVSDFGRTQPPTEWKSNRTPLPTNNNNNNSNNNSNNNNSSGSSSKTWACSACSYLNEGDEQRCELCQTEKDPGPSQPSGNTSSNNRRTGTGGNGSNRSSNRRDNTPPPNNNKPVLVCPGCTLENELTAAKCAVCRYDFGGGSGGSNTRSNNTGTTNRRGSNNNNYNNNRSNDEPFVECKRCTVHNPLTNTTCSTCGASLF